jgi:hypothetical protein
MNERSAQCAWGYCLDHPVPPSSYCGFHKSRRAQLYRERHRAKRMAEYATRKQAGVCVRRGCDEPPCATSVLCQKHVEQQRSYAGNWQQTPDGAVVHARKQKIWREKMLAKGLCVICGSPVETLSTRKPGEKQRKCERCRSYVNAKRLADRIISGRRMNRCSLCHEPGHSKLICPGQQTEKENGNESITRTEDGAGEGV